MPPVVLTTSDAEAQAQPTAPAPTAAAPTHPAMSGMERRHERLAARRAGREERRSGREERREARRTAREERREARRGGSSLYMKAGETTKQK